MRTFSLLLLLSIASRTIYGQCSDSLLDLGSISVYNTIYAAMDSTENLYVRGIYDSAASFSGINVHSNHFKHGVYLNKYSTDRKIVFAKTLAESKSNFDYSTNFGLFRNGVYIAYQVTDSLYINGTYYAPNDPNYQMFFLIKTDLDGTIVWQKVFQYKDMHSSAPSLCMSCDNNGNVYINGRFTDTLQLGSFTLADPSALTAELMFTCKIDGSGNVVWASRSYYHSLTDYAFTDDIHVMRNGKIIVTGTYHGTTDLGSLSGGSTASALNSTAPFAICYDTSGNPYWLWNASTTSANPYNETRAISDAANNTYITGSLNDSTNFGSTKLVGKGSMFLAKISSSGLTEWAKLKAGKLGTLEGVFNMAINSKNQLVLAGLYFDSTYFGATKYISAGGIDFFTALYDTSGVLLHADCYGGTGTDILNVPLIHKNDSIAFCGTFNSPSLSINGKTINKTGTNAYDIFFYDPCAQPTDVQELNKEVLNLTVFPNPSTGYFEMHFDNTLTTDADLIITDVFGRQMFRGMINKGADHYKITLRAQPGIYFAEFRANINSITKRIVIL